MPLINSDTSTEPSQDKIRILYATVVASLECHDFKLLMDIPYTQFEINAAFQILTHLRKTGDFVRVLLCLGADLNVKYFADDSDEGEHGTALHVAIGSGNVNLIRALLACHVDFLLRNKSTKDVYQIFDVAHLDPEIRIQIQNLLNEYGITRQFFTERYKFSTKAITSTRQAQLMLLKKLINPLDESEINGILEELGDHYCSPVEDFLTAQKYGWHSVEYLVLSKAIRNKKPSIYSKMLNNPLVREGLQRGADSGIVLAAVLISNNVPLARFLLQILKIDEMTNVAYHGQANKNYQSPLMLAVEKDFNAGADLILTVAEEKSQKLMILNCQDLITGMTPLMIAAQRGNYLMVLLLLAHQADATLMNVLGLTASDLTTCPKIKALIGAAMPSVMFSVSDAKEAKTEAKIESPKKNAVISLPIIPPSPIVLLKQWLDKIKQPQEGKAEAEPFSLKNISTSEIPNIRALLQKETGMNRRQIDNALRKFSVRVEDVVDTKNKATAKVILPCVSLVTPAMVQNLRKKLAELYQLCEREIAPDKIVRSVTTFKTETHKEIYLAWNRKKIDTKIILNDVLPSVNIEKEYENLESCMRMLENFKKTYEKADRAHRPTVALMHDMSEPMDEAHFEQGMKKRRLGSRLPFFVNLTKEAKEMPTREVVRMKAR